MSHVLTQIANLRQTLEHATKEVLRVHADEEVLGRHVKAMDETVRELRRIVLGERDGLTYRLALFEERWRRLEECLTTHEEMHETLRELSHHVKLLLEERVDQQARRAAFDAMAHQVTQLWETRQEVRTWWAQRLGRWVEILVVALAIFLATHLAAPRLLPPQALPPPLRSAPTP